MDHDGSTAYCCYFDLDYNYLKLEWDTGRTDSDGKKLCEYHLSGQNPKAPEATCNGKTFTQYEGIARPAFDLVSFDFDDEDNPDNALDDVRKFIEWLSVDDILIFYSGSKGFHVMVPFGYFPLVPSEHLPKQLKDLAKHLKESKFPTLDTSIYNYNRKFRVPFSQHEKTLRFKTLLTESEIKNYDMEELQRLALENNPIDFLDILPEKSRSVLLQISTEFEQAQRKSYEIEKERAGTIEQPSPFESFDNKLCIQKMINSRCDDIGRNNAALRIVNDYYRTGKTQTKCEADLFKWSQENGLPLHEVTTIIANIYERNHNYNFGCQDECKSVYCSAKCDIWKRLDPEKRPTTVDMPVSSLSTNREFDGVQWLMEKVFGAVWDEEKNAFSFGSVVKQNAEDLFYYKDNYWQYLDKSKIQILKTKLNAQFRNKLSEKKLEAIFRLFVLYVPSKPDDIDLFSPSPDMANFKDGTLHLVRYSDQFKLEFKKHDKENFCTTIIDQEFERYSEKRNDLFENWLREYLDQDEDKYRLIQEMFGASLMPMFPQFFVLLGSSGTGKSTTIKILKRLHRNDDNISGVSPDKFHGFHMASMIGKLLNIVMDIKTNCKIDDDIVKSIDDRAPMRIERKRKDDVYVPLPALHIFGANKMPSTFEGYSGAMKRRFSIINFDKVFSGVRNAYISDDLFDHDPQGVLNFALEGLFRLVEINKGNYTATESSQKNVEEWTSFNDVYKLFIDEMTDEGLDLGGEAFRLIEHSDAMILKTKLWKAFQKWQEEALDQRNQFGKMRFYKLLKDAGIEEKRFSHGRYFSGLGESIPENDQI